MKKCKCVDNHSFISREHTTNFSNAIQLIQRARLVLPLSLVSQEVSTNQIFELCKPWDPHLLKPGHVILYSWLLLYNCLHYNPLSPTLINAEQLQTHKVLAGDVPCEHPEDPGAEVGWLSGPGRSLHKEDKPDEGNRDRVFQWSHRWQCLRYQHSQGCGYSTCPTPW